MLEAQLGSIGQSGAIRIVGFQELLSLDARGRFRLPDELAGTLHRALAASGLQAVAAAIPPAAFQRLSFYFVPGPARQILLYPPANIGLVIDRFEDPPAGMDAQSIRAARDYLYYRMRFVEADKQNRLQIPQGLREHAMIGSEVDQIALVAHNHWLSLTPAEVVVERAAENLEAFERMAPDLLDPAHRTPPAQGGSSPAAPPL